MGGYGLYEVDHKITFKGAFEIIPSDRYARLDYSRIISCDSLTLSNRWILQDHRGDKVPAMAMNTHIMNPKLFIASNVTFGVYSSRIQCLDLCSSIYSSYFIAPWVNEQAFTREISIISYRDIIFRQKPYTICLRRHKSQACVFWGIRVCCIMAARQKLPNEKRKTPELPGARFSTNAVIHDVCYRDDIHMSMSTSMYISIQALSTNFQPPVPFLFDSLILANDDAYGDEGDGCAGVDSTKG